MAVYYRSLVTHLGIGNNRSDLAVNIKIRKADVEFSKYIRHRANWRCEVPTCQKDYRENTQGLHCSHYYGRGRENTRFDPDNCIALCYYHHSRWGHGDERDSYTEYMERRLGQQAFKKLKLRAFQFTKKDDKLALIYIKQLLDGLNGTSGKRSAGRPRGIRLAA